MEVVFLRTFPSTAWSTTFNLLGESEEEVITMPTRTFDQLPKTVTGTKIHQPGFVGPGFALAVWIATFFAAPIVPLLTPKIPLQPLALTSSTVQ